MLKRWVVALLSVVVWLGVSCTEKKREIAQEKERTKANVFHEFDSVRTQTIDAFFTKRFKRGAFNGNVLIAHEDSVFVKSYGWSRGNKKAKLEPNHIFQLASVSKPLTAVGVMKLVEEGKLNLKDSLQKYLPNFPYKGIELGMLLSHKSGLSNYMYITDSIWTEPDIPLCNENLYDSLIKYQPQRYYAPNKKYNYCNTNYFLLARIIEKVTGLSFESYMEEEVFGPLKMEQTLFYSGMNYQELEGVAISFDERHHQYPEYYLNGVSGDKGAYSSVFDLFKLDRALLKNNFLTAQTKHLMFTPQTKFHPVKHQAYAYGWRIKKAKKQHKIIFHNGWWRGYRSYFIRIPEEKICIAILSNSLIGGYLKQSDLLGLLDIDNI